MTNNDATHSILNKQVEELKKQVVGTEQQIRDALTALKKKSGRPPSSKAVQEEIDAQHTRELIENMRKYPNF